MSYDYELRDEKQIQQWNSIEVKLCVSCEMKRRDVHRHCVKLEIEIETE